MLLTGYFRITASDTTSVGENIIFRPSATWRKDVKEEKPEVGSMKDKLKDKKVKCRICTGEHFTAKCPYKDTMAPVGEEGSADVAAGPADIGEAAGGLGSGKSSYVPPHLRNGGAAAGERMAGGSRYERDDLATLRVTNVSILGPHHRVLPMADLTSNFRFRKWRKNKSFGICLSDLAESPECSWPRTGKPAWRRVSHSSASQREPMLPELARRWMDLDSSISFSEWNLPRRLLSNVRSFVGSERISYGLLKRALGLVSYGYIRYGTD